MAKGPAVTATQEIERKYEVPSDLVLPDPRVLLGVEPVGAARDDILEAVYYDTPDLRLLRDGVTLRRRTGGLDAGWHLKLPVGPDHREELRLPLTPSREPPAELVALARAHARGVPLGPVAELTTRRRTWTRSGARGPQAELVDDEVNARLPGPDPVTRTWHEVEVELGADGGTGLLTEIDGLLRSAGLRRSAAPSKLRRALADRVPPELPGPGPRPDAGAALVAYLAKHALVLRAHDPLVRLDRPDGVHQMRVAARRMRSALQAYGRVLDRVATAPVVAELAWLAGELGPARDTEVLAAHIAAMLDDVPEELVLGPVRATMTRTFSRRSAEARTRALAALDSDRYLALLGRLDDLVADPPRTAKASRDARREVPRSVARAYARLDGRIAAVGRAAPGEDRNVALHDARKAAKRLRYATEVATPVVGAPSLRLQRRLTAVQDLLGTHQDTTVCRTTLRELAVVAQAQGGNGFTFGLLYAAEADRAARAEAGLPAVEKRLRKPRNVAWLRR